MDLRIFVRYQFGMNGAAGVNAKVNVAGVIDNDSKSFILEYSTSSSLARNFVAHLHHKNLVVKPFKTELVQLICSEITPFHGFMVPAYSWSSTDLTVHRARTFYFRRRCDGMISDKYENQFSRSDKAASLLPLFSSGSCAGTNIQFRKCPLRPCSSKDSTVSRPSRGLRYGMEGIWSEWTEWSPCSKSCGTGLKTRKRKCMEGACRGLSEMPKKCKKKVCPVFNPKKTIMKFVHEKDKPCGALKE